MDNKDIKIYLENMLKSDYERICEYLLPNDKRIFDEKYLDKKPNREINASNKEIKLLQSKLNRIISNIKTFKIKGATKAEIIFRCKQLNKNNEYINFMIDAFSNNLTNSELADKYYLDIRTIAVYKTNRKRELENM